MTGRLRIIDTGLADPRWNAAASAALLDGVDCGRAPPTLRFHRYERSCVLGRFQDAAAELDLAGCRRSGTAVARRVTGGGAVVMGPGILAWDLVLPGSGPGVFALAARAGSALVDALAALGLAARLATPGSVEIAGRKVSGSAGRAGRTALLHQATLVVDLGEAAPLSLLRRRTEGGRPTADPAHRVTSLATILGEPARLDECRQVLTGAVANAFGLVPEPGAMNPGEHRLTEARLADEVGCDDFVFGEGDWRRAA